MGCVSAVEEKHVCAERSRTTVRNWSCTGKPVDHSIARNFLVGPLPPAKLPKQSGFEYPLTSAEKISFDMRAQTARTEELERQLAEKDEEIAALRVQVNKLRLQNYAQDVLWSVGATALCNVWSRQEETLARAAACDDASADGSSEVEASGTSTDFTGDHVWFEPPDAAAILQNLRSTPTLTYDTACPCTDGDMNVACAQSMLTSFNGRAASCEQALAEVQGGKSHIFALKPLGGLSYRTIWPKTWYVAIAGSIGVGGGSATVETLLRNVAAAEIAMIVLLSTQDAISFWRQNGWFTLEASAAQQHAIEGHLRAKHRQSVVTCLSRKLANFIDRAGGLEPMLHLM